MRSVFTCALLAVLAQSAAAGVTPLNDRQWSRLTPPQVPFGAVSTYDPSHDRAILIPTAFSPPGETWQAFAAGRHGWARTVSSPEAPEPSTLRGAIYTPHHGLIVFARRPEDSPYGPGRLGVWSVGSKGVGEWSRLAVDSEGPSDRAYFALVNDTRRDRLILFGGGRSPDTAENADTWTLDLSARPPQWLRVPMAVDPPPRSGMGAAYDSLSDRVLVYGGSKRFPNGGGISGTNELWSLDLSRPDHWDSLGTSGLAPAPGYNAVLTPVPGVHQMLLCERGLTGAELWRLALEGLPTWTRLADAPAAVGFAAVVLLGPTHDRRWYALAGPANSWTFDLAHPDDWHLENAPFSAGPSLDPQVLLGDPVTGTDLATESVGYVQEGAGLRQENHSDVWRLAPGLPPVWSHLEGTDDGPVNFNCLARAFDSRRLRWVLIGSAGTDPAHGTIELWSLTVGLQPRWSKVAFDGVLPDRLTGATAAYDPLRDRIVTYGGGFGPGSSDVDVLELAGTPRWRSIALAGALPHPRSSASLIFDPARDRFLMFGGTTSRQTATEPDFTTYIDVWSLRVGATAMWDSIPTLGSRFGQFNAFAFFDPAREGLGVIGGQTWVPETEGQDLHELFLGTVAAWDSWPARSPSAPPGTRLGPYVSFQNSVDLGLDRVLSLRNGHQVWALDRGSPTHVALLDLSPGDATNTLRPDAHGFVNCAILSDPAFDARTVDPSSVTLAGAPAHAAAAADRATMRDVNGDGRPDRVLKFARADMTLDPSVDVVALAGRTQSGEAVVGWDLYRLDPNTGAGGRIAGANGVSPAGDPDAPNTGVVPAHLGVSFVGAGALRGAATVRLALPHAASNGVIEIFAVDGRRVARRELGALNAGTRDITLGETATLASGVYFALIRVGGETATARFVALR
jgi:hypothetical protein